jgi:hypothetical protein
MSRTVLRTVIVHLLSRPRTKVLGDSQEGLITALPCHLKCELIYFHRSCVSPADMSNFIRLGVNQCGAGGAQGVWAAGFQGGDEVVGVPYTVLAMVDSNNAGVVDVP